MAGKPLNLLLIKDSDRYIETSTIDMTSIFNMKGAIPTTQIAAIIENPGPKGTVRITNTHPVETPNKNQVLVKLAFSGIW